MHEREEARLELREEMDAVVSEVEGVAAKYGELPTHLA